MMTKTLPFSSLVSWLTEKTRRKMARVLRLPFWSVLYTSCDSDPLHAEDKEYSIITENEVVFRRQACAVALLKRSPATFRAAYEGTLEEGAVPSNGNFASHLQLLTMGAESEWSPFELVHLYLQNGFAPLFNAVAKQSESANKTGAGDDDREELKVGVPNVMRKIMDLSMALMQCQQNVDIENISLPIDPEIAEAFEKAKSEGRQLSTDDFKERMNDSTFQNQLQSGVNKWSKEIQRVAKMQRDSSTGSTMQEINFWLGMEKVLNDAQQQLQTPEIQLTLNLLRGARRFLATMSFEADTGLKPAIEKVSNYLSLLRDFPINELLVASSIEQLTQAVRTIFNHLKRIRNANQYPLWRAYNLVEAVSRDLSDRLLKILSTQRLMQQDAEMFSQNMSNCQELFRVWKDEVGQFRQLVREQLKKRGNERPTVKINCEHEQLQARIEELQKFRRHHMKLQEIIERVLVDGKETGAKAEVAAAYQLVEQVDVLDVSRRGQQEWESTQRRYDERIDHAESEITARLRDKLGAAKTATEMFRVFSRFNALFVRPRIRRAIQEYQSSLIQQVKEDVHRLQEKFKETYEGTQACKLTAIRGLPPTAGLIVWARQLERRLAIYMSRVEDVLGKGWENHVDGKNLKQEGDAFARKMKTSHIFDEWLADTKDSKKFDVSMRIFDIQQGYQTYLLLVNFDEQIITLFKEVRNLQALGDYRVPYAIKVNSDEAKQNYPFAMTLQEAARTYMQTCAQIKADHQPLMASFQKGVQDLIADGLHLKWDDQKIESYTQKLSETVFQFQQKFTELESMAEQMSRTIESLDDVNVRQESSAQEMLLAKFEKMQKTVDDMNLASFSNMDTWVQGLNKQIEQRLVKLLAATSAQWLQEFKRWPLNGNNLIQEAAVQLAVLELHMQTSPSGVRLVLEPQKEFAMTHWVKHYHDCLGMVCNLPLLQAARFDALKRGAKESAATHRGLIALLDQKTLIEVYDHVSSTVEDMQEYVSSWMQYQSLWEINTSAVLSRLGDDLSRWHSMLTEIQYLSSRFEGSEQEKYFGPIVVDYSKVQSRVKAKYDQWHRDLLNSFGEKVREAMSEFFRQVNQGRERLEAVDGSGDLTVVCMAVLKVKTSAEKWSPEFEELQKAQKLLVKQRFQFPEDWMHIEQVQGEWEAFEQILTRRNRILDHELPKLRSVLVQKDKQLEESITQLYAEWSSQKPVQGGLKPTAAMQAIKDFDERLLMLREQHSQLVQLKKSLQMEVGDVEALAPLQEEMGNLKDVWSEINTVHSRVETLKETLWTAVEPKRIKHALEDLLSNMKQMDRRLQQYEAFDHIQEQLQAQIKLNQVVAELKTDALKERHWKQIVQMLKLSVGFNELTLGHLWDSNLEKHQPAIKEMLARAQGEMGLEQFLAEVREKWSNYDLELVPYKSKCRLIRSWDDLFSQLDEHLQSIQSMKMSPYYKSFEDEGATWDDRLNKIRIVFDLWMDVQRRWVYLEGIFGSSADIQQLLPNEFARFKTIDSEFVGLMKKVAAKPKVLEAVGIEGVQKQLDRLSDMLTAVQKALGDYLEKQRSQFARFYFVGDEDLLEMIGNSKDVAAVSRHLARLLDVEQDEVLTKLQP
ncbi:Dync1h1 [Symbiodinium sp. CCMP2456]|nr:Dync1h1 [Symbiodinium sp. CCMP2456]